MPEVRRRHARIADPQPHRPRPITGLCVKATQLDICVTASGGGFYWCKQGDIGQYRGPFGSPNAALHNAENEDNAVALDVAGYGVELYITASGDLGITVTERYADVNDADTHCVDIVVDDGALHVVHG